MEHVELCRLPAAATRSIIRNARGRMIDDRSASTFSELPAEMLFAPSAQYSGSLHLMFLSTLCAQAFHYHPSDRCVIVLGDVNIRFEHAAGAPETNPHFSSELLALAPFRLHCLRFPAFLWHRFQTLDGQGSGALIVSFHGDDNLEGKSDIPDNLMEELTFFWSGSEGEVKEGAHEAHEESVASLPFEPRS